MFGIGPQELILILVGALIIFGPQRLPEIAAQIGKTIRDVRRMSDDLTGEFQRSMNLDEPTPAPPVLTSEVIPASSTPNGIGDTIAQSLRVETVPVDPEPTTTPIEETPASDEQIPLAEESNTQQDTVISLAPMATKTDALVGVSLLDEPTPYVGETSKEKPEQMQDHEIATGSATIAAASIEPEAETTPADAGSYVYQPSAIPDTAPLALDAAPEPSNEADAVRAQGTIADAWDAVITTEATTAVAVAEPETAAEAPVSLYPADTYAAASGPFPEPERERVDPTAEPTIREKIEAQVAAEAFRERRRLAHYQRTRSKNS
ncbi:MAG TPA: twin-arginine translocase TatA/TatE family subunit [Thermomicrobiales bacterium]|jgi:TatA/E family protein of Tat protein translocase